MPPPDASSPCWWGDQAIAFTAARWSLYCCTGRRLELFHTSSCGNQGGGLNMIFTDYRGRFWREDSNRLTLLSLPPDARCWWSGDHFRPHTSCL